MGMFRPLQPVTVLPALSRRICLGALLLGFAWVGAACTGTNVGDFGATVQPLSLIHI